VVCLQPPSLADVQIQIAQAEDGGEGEDLEALVGRLLETLKSRIASDAQEERLKNAPEEGDIKVSDSGLMTDGL